jgi:D-amino-acid dehydrogenase
MKVLVLGGGVIGIASAYYLARDGCEVGVVEGNDGVGREASGSNAGILAAGHAFAWASPRAPLMLLRSLLGQQTAIRVRLRPDPGLYAWGLRFLRECTAERARRNTLVKLRLSQYSLRLMADLVRRESISYHAINRGALYLYRDPHELEVGVQKMRLLAEHGQQQQTLDANGVAKLDPVFEPVKHKIAGAVLDVNDSSGDSRLFTEELARVCRENLGVAFHTGTRVRALRADGDRITKVVTDRGEMTADVYVLALGVYSPIVARTAGARLPVYPAKGYSSTFPLRPGAPAPTIPTVDEQWLVAWSRMGDRLRLTSTAEFTGYDMRWTPRNFANIRQLAGDLFPDAVDFERGEYKACLRPMTPAGPPIVGAGRHKNLFFNTGHGHMGFTMACGSGRVVADLLLGRAPELDPAGLTPRPVRRAAAAD